MGLERMASPMEGLAKAAEGRLGREVRPERLEDLFPMQLVAGLYREELDEGPGLGAVPGRIRDALSRSDHPEPTQKLDMDGAGNSLGERAGVTFYHCDGRPFPM
jgi:hypothetical protein